jgi:hypothetical protein
LYKSLLFSSSDTSSGGCGLIYALKTPSVSLQSSRETPPLGGTQVTELEDHTTQELTNIDKSKSASEATVTQRLIEIEQLEPNLDHDIQHFKRIHTKVVNTPIFWLRKIFELVSETWTATHNLLAGKLEAAIYTREVKRLGLVIEEFDIAARDLVHSGVREELSGRSRGVGELFISDSERSFRSIQKIYLDVKMIRNDENGSYKPTSVRRVLPPVEELPSKIETLSRCFEAYLQQFTKSVLTFHNQLKQLVQETEGRNRRLEDGEIIAGQCPSAETIIRIFLI